MKLSDLGEFGLIDRIRRTFSQRSTKAPIGIGDDAAALSFSSSSTVLATTDLLIEGVHFDLATTDLYSLGWKSAAANLSDIAAMGGKPRFCLIGLGLPRRITVEQIDGFYKGFRALAGRHHALIIGGDTCRSEQGFLVSVTVLGESPRTRIVARSGSRPGDLIFVTGALGDSGAGLEILEKRSGTRRMTGKMTAAERSLVERHLRPVPRVEWGRKIAASGCASAMIDVSDGLSSDLGHICEASRVGAEVLADRVPLTKALLSSKGLRRPALEYALSAGEDYELLFTVPANKLRKLRNLRIPVTGIGRIMAGRTMTLITAAGTRLPLEPSGYDHFRPRVRTKGARP
jgi:thiamine-monophosphate kinase